MTHDTGIKQQKQQLRSQMMRLLRALSPTQRERCSNEVRRELLLRLQQPQVIAAYAATWQEPDLDPLWSDRLFAHRLILYPRIDGTEMYFCPVAALDQLRLGRFGVREPVTAPASEPPDVILVPGLAFGKDGSRLGRGGGFYDRFLSKLTGRTRKVGVGFEFQLLDSLPMEPYDSWLDETVIG